jgi:phosphoserine aminotransferase
LRARNKMGDRSVFTFSPGPAIMPNSVLEQLAESIIDYNGTGISIAEVSHRSREYIGGDSIGGIFPHTRTAFKELLNVPDNYEIIFIGGGASSEFGNIVRNLVPKGGLAQYINTGNWSQQAYSTAKVFEDGGLVQRIESIGGIEEIDDLKTLRQIPPGEINPDAAFVHITPNETIGGIQYQTFPNTGKVPLVADMSSEIFTREFGINDFGAVYACAQKNFGLPNLSVVIIRKDLLGDVLPGTIPVEDYKTLAEKYSAINTPPVVEIYTAGLIAGYIKEQGGVEEMARQADERSGLVYRAIDKSNGFYISPVQPEVRSKLNIPFLLKDKSLEDTFKQEAKNEGLLELGGHRSVGGLRASMYVGMQIKGAEMLAHFMQHFAVKHG